MADNYLEKQYAQYEAKKAAWEKSRKFSVKKSNIKEYNKRVFITGGAYGIGRSVVKAFSEKNYKVAFCDMDEQKGKSTSIETGATFFHVDVKDRQKLTECMNSLFKEWGDIDIIINNVGIGNFKDITETTPEDFENILSINLVSAFTTSRLLAIHRNNQIIKNRFGRIINMCSTRYLMSESGTEGYSASKGGIHSLTHSLAVSLSQYNITVNCISPGWIQNSDYEKLTSEDHNQHPSRRVGKPEDIARMCLFLCSEDNDFINGENIVIDGGMTKKMIYL